LFKYICRSKSKKEGEKKDLDDMQAQFLWNVSERLKAIGSEGGRLNQWDREAFVSRCAHGPIINEEAHAPPVARF